MRVPDQSRSQLPDQSGFTPKKAGFPDCSTTLMDDDLKRQSLPLDHHLQVYTREIREVFNFASSIAYFHRHDGSDFFCCHMFFFDK